MLPLVWWGLSAAAITVTAPAGAAAGGATGNVTLVVGLSAAFVALAAPITVAVIQRKPPTPGPDPMTNQLVKTLLADLEEERDKRRAAEQEAADLRARMGSPPRRRPRPPA